jgi:hypothetical protein
MTPHRMTHPTTPAFARSSAPSSDRSCARSSAPSSDRSCDRPAARAAVARAGVASSAVHLWMRSWMRRIPTDRPAVPRWGFLLSLALGLSTVGVAAQPPVAEDPRWFPFLGCWEPVGAETLAVLCVHPGDGGVRIQSWVEGAPEPGDLLLIADGRARPVDVGGCEGTRRVSWSADGRRVFLDEALRCGADALRTSRGILAFTAGGDGWAELQEIESPGVSPVLSVRRVRRASAATVAAFGVESLDSSPAQYLLVETSRAAAARPMDPSGVVEAVREAGASVTGALIAELGNPFPLNAAALRTLKRDGVPDTVLDLMIAVTWPDRFEIRGVGEVASVTPEDPNARWDATGQRYPAEGHPVQGRARGVAYPTYGVWGPVWGSPLDPWYDPFFYGGWARGPYGQTVYRWAPGSAWGVGGWNPVWGPEWYVGRPLVVVVDPAPGRPFARGSVSPDGYVRPGGTSPAAPRTASPTPATATPTPNTNRPPATAPTPPAASTAPPAQTAPPPPEPPRQAVPRNQSGGGGGGV